MFVEIARLLLILAGFVGAAMFQTVRFPHFSSMKAVFVLPALGVIALCMARGFEFVSGKAGHKGQVINVWLTTLFVVGVVHVILAIMLNSEALGAPTSPQWPLPGL